MMLKWVAIFSLLLYNCEGVPKEIMCPDYCVCDTWNDLRRATCQYKKLYSIEINMPSQVEILDISHNQVSELGRYIFLETNLTDLKLLNLSHNKVGQIHLDSFEGLKELKTLDLSFNSIQYFNDHWFSSLRYLQELYIRGNKLMSINTEPKLNLPFLKVLDISLCNIEHLRHGAHIFKHLHSLEVLDVSDNFLTTLHVDVIRPLNNLSTLLAKNNPFKCENIVMSRLTSYTHAKGINYDDPCSHRNLSSNNEKFQRMIIEKPAVPKKNSWIYDEEKHDDKVDKIVCEDTTTMNSTINLLDEHLIHIIDLSPSLVLLVTLICGIIIGLLLGCLCQFNRKSKTETVNPDDRSSTPLRVFQRQNSLENSINRGKRSRTRSVGSRKMYREDRDVLLLNENHLYDSTPVLARKTFE